MNPAYVCRSSCPCCPDSPYAGSISATIVATPDGSPEALECGWVNPTESSDIFDCGIVDLPVGLNLSIRVRCEDGNWVAEYSSFATNGVWTSTPATVDCPTCNGNKAEGSITFDTEDGCESSGGDQIFGVSIEITLEGPC